MLAAQLAPAKTLVVDLSAHMSLATGELRLGAQLAPAEGPTVDDSAHMSIGTGTLQPGAEGGGD